MRWSLRRRSAATATFAAVLGTALMVMQPAASAAQAAPAAPASKTVNYSCQTRSGGVETCEWFSTSIITKLGAKTTQLRGWASMKGSTSKAITQVQSWGIVGLGDVPQELGALKSTAAGTGTISSADGWLMCGGFADWRVEFKYKYWLPKPTSAWITGTAISPWLYNVTPCKGIGGP